MVCKLEGRLLDARQLRRGAVSVFRLLFHHEVAVAYDDGEGRLQFVGDVGKELGFVFFALFKFFGLAGDGEAVEDF